MARKRYVEGLEHARSVFDGLAEAELEKLTDALNRGGREMVSVARTLAPRSDDDLHVADDIHHRLRPRADGRAVEVMIWAGSEKETRDAAFRSEFGRHPGGEGQERHPGHEAQPFFWVAWRAVRRRVRSRVRRALRAGAKAAVQRGRR
ncbi:hypothetical protein LNKW23_17980 [Paralimibaculum aggregatum]|uniref:HK97 gp10 family phage protein n=1 Tax=Paralimibaculum aggregatum TaxID=3036245 RepID=A0ABQ6LQ48_9RHOB|nr:hypothetical protein [Limibaculum sp. NKW23]GMG82585.1 hypothetical protein LNKW23_17980 [Limibaculum sp. NKW23]